MKAVLWLGLLLIAASAASARPSPFEERLRLHRQLRALNADLLANPSATAVLQAICDRRAPGQTIVARKTARHPDEGAEHGARADLGVGPDEPIAYRSVDLTCGGQVLSNAENWYVPARLTPAMNRTLTETQTPFGVVARPLGFRRRTLSSEFLFEPLPPGWEGRPRSAFVAVADPPPHVLRHRAVLETADGRPFSLVVERYTAHVLAP